MTLVRTPATTPDAPVGPAARRTSTLRLAVAGCGTVGSALVRLLHERRPEIESLYGTRLELARVLVHGSERERPAELPRHLVTTDLDAFLAADADVVVELIGGEDPALRIARESLERGRRYVTANKLLLARHGPALARLARERGAALDFEGAVGGGIPVVRAIREQFGAGGIHAVRGIINGTTNYVLTRMAEGQRYAAALREAQRLGFAEADPTRDVSGEDAADKLRVLAWIAFGADPARLLVSVRGIGPEVERLVADARRGGSVVRLVAQVARGEEGLRASVGPAVVPASAPLGRVQGEENLVEVETPWNGVVRFTGPGAGGRATASAVLGDILRAVQPA